MKTLFICSASLLLASVLLTTIGCDATSMARPTDGEPGAFPPTISDTEYHHRAWTRTDCLVCHEKGVQNAPVVKHVSVPATAMDAKCRTCHVQVPGSKPAE